MAAIVRTGTNQAGASVPGLDVRPVNDFLSENVTMAVDVQAGQTVAVGSDGLGVLGDATHGIGIATMPTIAGRKVACILIGKMTGYTGLTPGTPVYLGASGELDTAGTIKVGLARSTTDILFHIAPN